MTLQGTPRAWPLTIGTPAAGRLDDSDGLPTGPQAVDRSMRRVRVFTATLMFVHFLGYQPLAGQPGGDRDPIALALQLVGVLMLNNLLSSFAARQQGSRAQALRITELAIDVAVTLAMTSLLQVFNEEVGWVLLIVPVLEAAVRFRLRGAVTVWGVIALVYMVRALDTLASSTGDVSGGFDQLEVAVQRVAVILLVSIPISYLSEHLVNDIDLQRAASQRAHHRGLLLKRVADVGHRISRLGASVDRMLLQGGLSLGFDAVDVCSPNPDDPETYIVSTRGGRLSLPPPDHACALIAPAVAQRHPVRLQVDDDDRGSTADLQVLGIGSMVACVVPADPHPVVVRAAFTPGRPMSDERVESLELLCRQAAVAMGNDQLVRKLNDAKERIQHQAHHDALTGLPNRKLFLARLATVLAERGTRNVAVLFVDLDRFKPVNDRFGHAVGDELLIAVSGRLRRATRQTDTVARLGGDEFCILALVDEPRDAEDLAKRVNTAMNQPFGLSVHEVTVSASIGVAFAPPGVDVDPGELMRRADVAMYDAKAGGKAAFRHFSADVDSEARDRIDLEHDLRRVLQGGDGLNVVYQPLVVTGTGQIFGAEALVRWHHPVLGPIEPSAFVPLAEDTGLITIMGQQVLLTACQEAVAWPADPTGRAPVVSVNVSWHQLRDPTFVDRVDEAIALTGLDPSRLLLEITERFIALTDDSAELLRALRGRGIAVGLDDFGQGETSLRQFGAFGQLDVLKLDRQLVLNGMTADAGRTILEVLVEMTHRLGLQVVAEGIESADQYRLVQDLGCDITQGYHLYPPIEARALRTLLAGDRAHLTEGVEYAESTEQQ